MGTAQATMQLRSRRPLWRAKVACALVFTVAVGVCTYAATYRALVLVSSTPAAVTAGPGPAHPAVTPTAPASQPASLSTH
jgi:hypothetical protein